MAIKAIRMPKWGLAMEEGTIIDWLIAEGDAVAEGDEILEIETTKITNVLEATNTGQLARIVAQTGEVMPVGAIIGVLTEGEVDAAEV
ncbi:MAG: biotin/lipoyl-containing protein, partial [Pseudomonadota bacterium]|nr:biotin/lipoyl-containing protein [Pseudomonadota bacterium]